MDDSKDPKHTVLCVDDEENILSALKRLLRKEAFKLLIASSGAEGLEILKDNDVQLVMCDQRMPGMNGTEFLARVKEEYPDIVRIILSGYTDVDHPIATCRLMPRRSRIDAPRKLCSTLL